MKQKKKDSAIKMRYEKLHAAITSTNYMPICNNCHFVITNYSPICKNCHFVITSTNHTAQGRNTSVLSLS